jgi:hypothetical protein
VKLGGVLAWRPVVLVAILLAVAGCGEDDDDPTPDGGDGYTPTLPAADAGCPGSHPNRIASDTGLIGPLVTCVDDRSGSLAVINKSSTVISVTNASRTVAAMSVSTPPAASFAEIAVEGAAPGFCDVPTGQCSMPPRATVVIGAVPPVRVTVDIDVGATAGATTADYLGALVQRRLAGRSAGLASGVQQCAGDAEQLAASLVYVEEAIRAAVDPSAACAGLLQASPASQQSRRRRPRWSTRCSATPVRTPRTSGATSPFGH